MGRWNRQFLTGKRPYKRPGVADDYVINEGGVKIWPETDCIIGEHPLRKGDSPDGFTRLDG